MTTLYGIRREQLDLAAALRWAGIDGIALLSTPSAYTVAASTPDGCQTPDAVVDLSTVFEARVFDADRELRWWHAAAGAGDGVVVSETETALPGEGQPLPPVTAVAVISGGYLLWGYTLDSAPPGWTRVGSTRIGSFTVPAAPGSAVPAGVRVTLRTREYVATEPTHGNAYVADERLVGLAADRTVDDRGQL